MFQEFIQRLQPLRRPLRITFERNMEDDDESMAEEHKSVYLSDLGDERVAEVFARHDRDGSGGLDTFELAGALAEVLGRPATTREVWAVISHGELEGDASLSLEQFAYVLGSFDWADPALREELPDSVFECTINEARLGLAVRVDGGGAVMVTRVESELLEGVVEVDDQVVAVNGAPIGVVPDSKALAARLRSLPRPLRITFERHVKLVPDFDPDVEDVAPAGAVERGGLRIADALAFTDGEIEEVFVAFDTNLSGDLDTFELASALESLTGRAPSTPTLMALLREAGAEGYALTLTQFARLVRSHDWDQADGGGEEGEGDDNDEGSILDEAFFEVVCERESLGFSLRGDGARGLLLVADISDPSLSGTIRAEDAIVAINGAPLGFVSDPEV